MKGNISRYSYRPDERYSGVYQVQGGMVTDADLGEQATIARRRTDALGHDSVGHGVPVEDGAVGLTANAGGPIPFLREGVVYAEGVRGELRATGPVAGGMDLYPLQVDFPMAPDLPASGDHLVYVDIWERMISHLEEPYLADAGLHGVETAFRSRTMTQVKIAPQDQLADIESGSGRFPRIGTGELTVTAIDPETIFDECDPCADTVAAEQTVPNALYRLEIVSVDGDANAPDVIRIAWSSENGSAAAPATVNHEDFERSGAVYEFFSTVTASHLGVHHDSAGAAVTAFVESLSETPNPPAAPGGDPWPNVRRWDGMVTVDFGAGTAERIGAGPDVTLTGDTVTITTDSFTAALDFDGKSVVAGDYWLVELRRLGTPEVMAVQATPVGILHNYCVLFRLSGAAPQPATDAEERMLSFPYLGDLPASHVGLVNNCEKLFGDAENVQEALDELCSISAEDIAFDPTGCPRLFDTTDNVQDALINLCKVDFDIDHILRHFMDWGVVCGVIPRLDKPLGSTITISAGTILDRSGAFGTVEQINLDLNAVKEDRIHFEKLEVMAEALAEGKVCLALAIEEGGVIGVHLIPEGLAFEPADPTLLSTYQTCIQTNPQFDFKGHLGAFEAKDRAVAEKVYYVAAKSDSIGANARLDQAEFASAKRYNQETRDKYLAFIDDPIEAERIDAEWKRLEEEIDVGGATGETQQIRRAQLEAAKAQSLLESDQQRAQRCLCDALLPRCPVLGEPPHFVPIACLRGKFSDGFILEEVCSYCCRKQSMNWRMVQYYIAELRGVLADRFIVACCPEPKTEPPKGPGSFGTILHPDVVTTQGFINQLDTGFAIFQGRKPPNEYVTAPNIGNLSEKAAGDVLRGNGAEVIETIDIADVEAISKIQGKTVGIDAIDRVLGGTEIGPGDKVALITRNGVAVDYVKLEVGEGRYIFPAEVAKGVPDAGAVDRLEARIAVAKEASAGISRELDAMREERATLTTDLAAANTSIESARQDLKAIREEQEAAAARLAETRAGLEAVAKERNEMVLSLRRNMPAIAIARDEPRFAEALSANGIMTLGELATMSPQVARSVAQASGLPARRVAELGALATEMINRPIE